MITLQRLLEGESHPAVPKERTVASQVPYRMKALQHCRNCAVGAAVVGQVDSQLATRRKLLVEKGLQAGKGFLPAIVASQ